MLCLPLKTRTIQDSDSLVEVVCAALKKHRLVLKERDVVCVVSKVVSLCEGGLVRVDGAGSAKSAGTRGAKRYGAYNDSAALTELIKAQADVVFPGEMFLTVKDGIFTPSAGVDTSNVPAGFALGWPRDAYASARAMWAALRRVTGVKKMGVLIFDSGIMPLRNGVTGVALGYAGFRGLEDYRGKRDLFRNILRVTQRNVADGLAAAATLVTGEGAESVPFVVIRDAPVKFTSAAVDPSEVKRRAEECLYTVLYPASMRVRKNS